MTLENLKNLSRINQLKAEPPDQREFGHGTVGHSEAGGRQKCFALS
jgi:hypothetical protein